MWSRFASRSALGGVVRGRNEIRDVVEASCGMSVVEGGVFLLGDDDSRGCREVELSSFGVDKTAVSNRDFAEFVSDTGFVTDAERHGWSFVFEGLLSPRDSDWVMSEGMTLTPWWLPVRGASWRAPFGPVSSVSDLMSHPVVHVSWRDASEFAGWAGKRLPTEWEWEAAARGGVVGARYPWGDDAIIDGEHQCNTWQGVFPDTNTGDDGYVGTAPVETFEPNGYGLYQVAGNVWEWCVDSWSTVPGAVSEREEVSEAKVIKGGSYLCGESCDGQCRVAARAANQPDSPMGNIGFRCVV